MTDDHPPIDALDLAHYATYGYVGELPTTRVTSHGRDNRPIQNPKTVPWTIPVPHTEVIKLYYGFRPSCMEEKWVIHTVGPDEEGVGPGTFEVHMARSWTGYEMIILKAEAEFEQGDQLKAGKHAKITEITWEVKDKAEDQGEAESKEVAIEVCRYVLQCRGVVDPDADPDAEED